MSGRKFFFIKMTSVGKGKNSSTKGKGGEKKIQRKKFRQTGPVSKKKSLPTERVPP